MLRQHMILPTDFSRSYHCNDVINLTSKHHEIQLKLQLHTGFVLHVHNSEMPCVVKDCQF